MLGWARLGLAQPAEHSWAPPAFSGFVWLCGCTWLPYRCSHTTLNPIAPIPDSGTCLCTNPNTPPCFPITDLLEKLRTMEPESTPPCPHPFPFPSFAFPRMRRQTNAFWTEGALFWAWDYPAALSPVLPSWAVIKSAGSGLGGYTGRWSLCRSPLSLPFYPC